MHPTDVNIDPAGPSDAQLVVQSIGEPERFGDLFDRHVQAIWRYVVARVGADAAEDIVSSTFAIAFDRRARFDGSASSARPWLYGIATNVLMKHRDAEMRWLRSSVVEDAPSDESEHADARVDAARIAPPLARALLALPRAERDVVTLHSIEGLTHDEIASALGIRAGTARTRLSRGLARMRALLEHDGDDR